MGFHAERLSVLVDFVVEGKWLEWKCFPPTRDTLTLTGVLQEVWRLKPRGKPIRVGVELSMLTRDGSVEIPMFDKQRRLSVLVRQRYVESATRGLFRLAYAAWLRAWW